MHNYRVVSKLAEGSAAEVFLARGKTSPEEVIVEVLRREVQSDSALSSKVIGEAKLRQSWQHPALTRRVGEGRTPDGRSFFVSEPVTGESLRTCLCNSGPIKLRELLKIAIPICDALHYLHQHGKIHGNLKPANVFLLGGLRAFNPKLFDSALALFRTGRALHVKPSSLVEPEYMSPERIGGQRANVLSDVYSLGLVLYEMATGGPPFTSREIRETRRRQMHESVPPLPQSHEALAPILSRALAKDPKSRFPSAAALRDELTALSQTIALDSAPGKPTPTPRFEPSLAEGKVLGNYQLQGLLGAGAMGQVFQARHIKLDRQMAIKLLRPEHASNRGFIDRFFQEARAANQINHEHIVEIFDFVEEQHPDGPQVYCVMELLQGKSLEQVIRKETVGIQRSVRIVRQICSALAAAHKVGVVHRDIKPDNIFITERAGVRDFAKVLDFGVAKLRPTPNGPDNHVDGEIVGTPAYMAPEQASGEPTDSRTDIYALGTVLYRILAGRLPFRAPSLPRHIAKLLTEPPPPMGDVTPGGEAIPGDLQRLILRCLEKDPKKRPQSMTLLSELLKPFEDAVVRRIDSTDEPYQMSHVEAALESMWNAEPAGPQMIAGDDVQLIESVHQRAPTPRPPPPTRTPKPPPTAQLAHEAATQAVVDVFHPDEEDPDLDEALGPKEPSERTRAERPLMLALGEAEDLEDALDRTTIADPESVKQDQDGLQLINEPLALQVPRLETPRPGPVLAAPAPQLSAPHRTPVPLRTPTPLTRPQQRKMRVYWVSACLLCTTLVGMTYRMIT
ncbi:MAG: serine/threonine-protein kinase, partial [Myxococcaceae bacterium]